MNSHDPYTRPATPQPLIHAFPSPRTTPPSQKPKKYIILLLAPTSVAGKVQIATSIAQALSCPLFQGDSLHESSARIAPTRERYQTMWLRKMVRTGLLFPEESRPANAFDGSTSSSSRRGSMSDSAYASSSGGEDEEGVKSRYVNRPVWPQEREMESPALMVLTHPELEPWHRDAIRSTVGEYGIGVIWVPLFLGDELEEEEDELPVLRPLDPRSFTSFDALKATGGKKLEYGRAKEGNLEEEMVLKINIAGNVDEITKEVVEGVKDLMFA